jgi:hypothetical protein
MGPVAMMVMAKSVKSKSFYKPVKRLKKKLVCTIFEAKSVL